MALAGRKAVKAAMDKKEKNENMFFHEIPLLAIKEMKENVKAAMKIFALQ